MVIEVGDGCHAIHGDVDAAIASNPSLATEVEIVAPTWATTTSRWVESRRQRQFEPANARAMSVPHHGIIDQRPCGWGGRVGGDEHGIVRAHDVGDMHRRAGSDYIEEGPIDIGRVRCWSIPEGQED